MLLYRAAREAAPPTSVCCVHCALCWTAESLQLEGQVTTWELHFLLVSAVHSALCWTPRVSTAGGEFYLTGRKEDLVTLKS
ncbi:hypothetical protein GDO78_022827 [Eleutherodactylus coqui]|uniref:Uncharacterized protein n=1 Tax=Eleutherodactylus coqui TaxID=57060 RepID=A0A8J6B7U2_ELECQ|nr:hypothetical protein GDO78_022827 [Eleutherodactylus coqui]